MIAASSLRSCSASIQRAWRGLRCLLVVVLDTFVDLAYGLLDPRVKYE
ncbi:MAG TPA: hypothetical protein VMB21_04640 [Candidatus Limnocylindria bacterium]|jgi:hypothetical protein|nr:hypothetical protein [Candidatus Limnocylindria bacterium]